MLKKVIVYFIVSLTVISSVVVYFILKETSPNTVVITGEYDIWATENVSEIILTTISDGVETEVHTDIIKTEVAVIETEIATEFLYININTANIEEFMKLDGIGEKKAKDIVNYRDSVAGFNNIEEIMNVNGIGEKTFYNIKNHIYVETPVYSVETCTPTEVVTEAVQEPYTEEYPIIETQPVEETEYTEVPTSVNPFYFDLNTVTSQELICIPEIDTELANNIIELRTSIKYFSNVYELLYVEGMSDEKFIKVRDYFYVINNNSGQ